MRRMLIFSLVVALVAACTHATNTPQPTPLAPDFPTMTVDSMRNCTPTDFLTSASSNGAPNAIMLGLTLTNISGSLCKLTNPPLAVLMDGNNQLIATQTSLVPTVQTPPAPALVALGNKDSVIVSLVWSNYCLPIPGGMLNIRLTLADDKYIEVPLKLPGEPGCDSKEKPSMVIIAPYSNPP